MLKKIFSLYFCVLAILASAFATESPPFDATIPVLDMAEYRDPATRQQFVDKLGDACRESGFFAVLNTDIDSKVLDDAYAACVDFFGQDTNTKLAVSNSQYQGQRGYVMSESAKNADQKDFKEFYHVGPELSDEQRERLKYFPNLWPDNMRFKTPIVALYQALEEYSVPLQEAFAAAIDQPLNTFTSRTYESDTLLRAIHYPANPPADSVWGSAHTDIDLFTILPRSTAKGLQVQNKDGEWKYVIVPDGAIIVNVGDMLENMTNGEFRSSVHRIVDPGENQERYSIVHFVHCRWTEDVSPLARSIERTGGVRKYADATEWELLLERLVDLGLATEDMHKQLGECGLMERLVDVGRASPDAMSKLVEAGYASEKVAAEYAKLNS